jgi:hypothetical protein
MISGIGMDRIRHSLKAATWLSSPTIVKNWKEANPDEVR